MSRLFARRSPIERKITATHARIISAREELAVVIEQLASLSSDEEETHTRALVSESTAANREWREAKGHATILDNRRQELLTLIADLEVSENELLSKLVV